MMMVIHPHLIVESIVYWPCFSQLY